MLLAKALYTSWKGPDQHKVIWYPKPSTNNPFKDDLNFFLHVFDTGKIKYRKYRRSVPFNINVNIDTGKIIFPVNIVNIVGL